MWLFFMAGILSVGYVASYITQCWLCGIKQIVFEPGHEKMCLMSYANNKGADQPARSDQRLCCSLLK